MYEYTEMSNKFSQWQGQLCQYNDIGMGSVSWKIVFESLCRQNILFFLQHSDWHWVKWPGCESGHSPPFRLNILAVKPPLPYISCHNL